MKLRQHKRRKVLARLRQSKDLTHNHRVMKHTLKHLRYHSNAWRAKVDRDLMGLRAMSGKHFLNKTPEGAARGYVNPPVVNLDSFGWINSGKDRA